MFKILAILIFCSNILLSIQQNCVVNFTGLPVNPYDLYTISTDPNNVVFYLYPNPANTSDYDVLTFDGTSGNTKSTRYNPKRGSIFLIHGFTGNYTVPGNPQTIKDVYLQNGFAANWNIIAVDWGKLATPGPKPGAVIPSISTASTPTGALTILGYQLAFCNVPIVGNRIGAYIEYLGANNLLPSSGFASVHIVGQSLGAMVGGYTGKYIIALKSSLGIIGRITGTEPAGPLYQEVGVLSSQRLDKSDATQVDVYHTNQAQNGYFGDLGKIDFYINTGVLQAQCLTLNITNAVALYFCSHNGAPFYYAMSIPKPPPIACECTLGVETCVPVTLCNTFGYIFYSQTFGQYTPSKATGSYAINLTLPPQYTKYLLTL